MPARRPYAPRKENEMFERTVVNTITCDFCGRTNKDVHCSVECFSCWQRLSIRGIDKNTDKLEYQVHDMLTDKKHLCPNCAELIYDLMSRKNYWVKVVTK